jgi:hypothetical protein
MKKEHTMALCYFGYYPNYYVTDGGKIKLFFGGGGSKNKLIRGLETTHIHIDIRKEKTQSYAFSNCFFNKINVTYCLPYHTYMYLSKYIK